MKLHTTDGDVVTIRYIDARKYFKDFPQFSTAGNRVVNRVEFMHRLNWMMEGSLDYHLSNFENKYFTTDHQVKLIKQFKKFIQDVYGKTPIIPNPYKEVYMRVNESMDTGSAGIGSQGSASTPDTGDFYATGDARVPKVLGKKKKKKISRFKQWLKKNVE